MEPINQPQYRIRFHIRRQAVRMERWAEPPHQPRGLVAAVGDQPVVDRRGGQHAHQEEGQRLKRCSRPQAGEEQNPTAQVGQEDEHRTETVQYTAPELGMPQLVEKTAQNLPWKAVLSV